MKLWKIKFTGSQTEKVKERSTEKETRRTKTLPHLKYEGCKVRKRTFSKMDAVGLLSLSDQRQSLLSLPDKSPFLSPRSDSFFTENNTDPLTATAKRDGGQW